MSKNKNVKKFKQMVGLEKPEEKTWQDEMEEEFDEMCGLTRTQRLYGFGICFALGWLVSFLACFALPQIGSNPAKFALLYTLGNIIALCSTCCMWGPCHQAKSMFKATRVGATIVYFIAMILTIFVAFYTKNAWLVILCLIFQLLAMIWYVASYFPYGRKIILNCCGSCIGVQPK